VNIRRQLLISAVAVGFMLALAFWALSRTSASEFAVHWNAAGEVSGLADRRVALLILPATALLVSALLAALPGLMPARSRLERSRLAYTATWTVVLMILSVLQVVLVAVNLGAEVDVVRVSALSVALVLLVIGNFMGKIRYNFVIGLRTPWTLADERVWDKSHRFTGRLMVLGALILAVTSLTLPGGLFGHTLLTAAIVACAAVPTVAGVVFSILISRRA
jgi:uncharacterized membrane protein